MSGRVGHLDGIRALAVVVVMGFHVFAGTWLFTGGYIGVTVFFVLSGFIITQILLAEEPSYRTFLRRRFTRLYPALVVMVALSGVVFLAIQHGRRHVLFDGFLSLVQLMWLARATHLSSGGDYGITWSLGIEWLFYLMWPAVLRVLSRRSPTNLARTCLVLGLFGWLIALPMPSDYFKYAPFAQFGSMLLGAAGAVAVREGKHLPAWTGVAAVTFLLAWSIKGPNEFSVESKLFYPVIALSAYALIMANNEPLRRLFSGSAVTAVGRASYSAYLWHTVPIFIYISYVRFPAKPGFGPSDLKRYVVVTVAGVVLSAISYRLIERRRVSQSSHHVLA